MIAILLPVPFWPHDKPTVETIAGNPLAYVIASQECGATGPKQLPGLQVEVAVDAWNRPPILISVVCIAAARYARTGKSFLATPWIVRCVGSGHTQNFGPTRFAPPSPL